jgi:hypothetical protein
MRTLAAATAAVTIFAVILLWMDRQRQAELTRFASLQTEMQSLSKQIASLSQREADAAPLTKSEDAMKPAAKATTKVPTPPPPPELPAGAAAPADETRAAAAAGVGIQLLDIGDDSRAHHGVAGLGDLAGPDALPYAYQELRSLVLAGIRPEAKRVDPAVIIDHFGPRYRSDLETPLVLQMHAAPSPFERKSIVISVGVGHQPVAAAVETNTDYTFILSGSGAGKLQRTLRKALLPWLFDKLDGSCRVSVVTAGAETETLLNNEPVRMTPEGQPVFGSLPSATAPALYDILRAQRQRVDKSRKDRRQHVMLLISDDATLPGPEAAPWPEQLGDFAAPWLDFTVVQIGDGAAVSKPDHPYLAELARQGQGRLISIGTDVLGWEEKLLPRVASLSGTALHAVGAELHFNPNLVAAFRALHAQTGWAQTKIGAADRWPKMARLGDGKSRTGVYLVTPQQGGEPDRVAEFRVRYDAGDAQFAARERVGLQPEQINNDFFTAPRQLQVPVVAAEISDILMAPESPDRKSRIAALREVWNRLVPSLAEDGDVTHKELGDLIAALW